MARRNRSSAQSIIETVVGIIFLIPIVLFLFDIGVMVLANTANDNLAKQAARAAAGATPAPPNDEPTPANLPQFQTAAQQAAQKIVDNFAAGRSTGYMTGIVFAKMWYNGNAVGLGATPPAAYDQNPGVGNVCVFTKIEAVAPVPFPGFDTHRTFFAKAVEPIVALPPQ